MKLLRTTFIFLICLTCFCSAAQKIATTEIAQQINASFQANSSEVILENLDSIEKTLDDESLDLDPAEQSLTKAQIYSAKASIFETLYKTSNEEDNKNNALILLDKAILLYSDASNKSQIKTSREEKRVSHRNLKNNNYWKKNKTISLKCKLASAWLTLRKSELLNEYDKEGLIKFAIKEFDYFINNGLPTDPIVVNAMIGKAQCYFNLSDFKKALSSISGEDLNYYNLESEEFQKLCQLKIKLYHELNSPLCVEDYANLYFELIDQHHRAFKSNRQLALIRIKNLCLLINDTAKKYSAQYTDRLNSFVNSTYIFESSKLSEIVSLLNSNNVLLPCCYLETGHSLILDNKPEQALEAFQAGLDLAEYHKPDTNTLSTLHYYKIKTLYQTSRYAPCFTASCSLLQQSTLANHAHPIAHIALNAGLKLIEQNNIKNTQTQNLYSEYLSFIDFCSASLKLDEVFLKTYKAKSQIAAHQFEQAIELLQNITAPDTNYPEACFLIAYSKFKLALKERGPEVRTNHLNESINALKKSLAQSSADQNNTLETNQQNLMLLIAEEILNISYNQKEVYKNFIAILPQKFNNIKTELELLNAISEQNISQIVKLSTNIANNPQLDSLAIKSLFKSSQNLESLLKQQTNFSPEEQKTIIDSLISTYIAILNNSTEPLTPASKITIKKCLANIHHRAENYIQSINIYEDLITNKDLELDSQIASRLADSLEKTQNLEKAIEYRQKLIRLLPKHSQQWYNNYLKIIVNKKRSGNSEEAEKIRNYILLRFKNSMSESWLEKFNTAI